MKFPLAWHEECLKNMRGSLLRDEAALDRHLVALQRRREEVEHYANQINLAKAKGKDGFDREKFGKAKP